MAEAAVPNVSLSTGSEAVFDIECAPCSAEGQHKEAVRYCRDCGTHLCGDCVRYHTKLPSLKHHRLVDNDAMTTTQGSPQVLDACTERCPDHKSEIIKFFCPDHNTSACSVCVTLDHKLCEHMEYIENAAAGLEERQDYKEFETRLRDLSQQSEDTVTLALENKQISSDCHTAAMQDLDAYREELVSAVDRHVEAIRDQAGQIHAQDTDKMDTLASEGNQVLTELRAVATNVDDLKSRKHFCKLFVEMKREERSFRKLRGHIENIKDHTVAVYIFQPDEDLQKMVGRQDCLGRFVIKRAESSKFSDTSNYDQTSNTQYRDDSEIRDKSDHISSKQRSGDSEGRDKSDHISSTQTSDTEGRDNYDDTSEKQERCESEGRDKVDKTSSQQVVNVPVRNAEKIADLNVKSTSNTNTCAISGMAVVSEDKVVAVDCNNYTIKLINTTRNEILSEHNPEGYPWDVAMCKDAIAATVTSSRKIVFLKHAQGLLHDREISVNGSCRGIDWYDDKLYVVFDDEKKLEVMTTTGTVLQTLSTTTGGQQLFSNPWYVTVSVANQRIYVSDIDNSRLVVLDMNGRQKGTYKDQPAGTRQLAIDGAGVMYLCGYGTNNVHLLSPAGKKVKILLTEQEQPYAVCYCEKTGHLYVGMNDCNAIKVYKITF